MDAASKECDQLQLWRPAIVNHLYWTAASTPDGNPAVMEAKWRSLVNHIQDIHDHDTPAFSSCAHGPLDGDQRNKEWLDPGTVHTVCGIMHALQFCCICCLSDCLDALTCDLCDEMFSFTGNLITFCLLFMFAIIHMCVCLPPCLGLCRLIGSSKVGEHNNEDCLTED